MFRAEVWLERNLQRNPIPRSIPAAILAALVLFSPLSLFAASPAPAHSNPTERELQAPSQVRAIFRHACYDCHSDRTRWPWYSYVPPVSWWIRRDVDQGRKRLNFSAWQDYASDPGTKDQKLAKIGNLIDSGAMPPWYYAAIHPEAKISAPDRAAITRWITAERSSLAGSIDSPPPPIR